MRQVQFLEIGMRDRAKGAYANRPRAYMTVIHPGRLGLGDGARRNGSEHKVA